MRLSRYFLPILREAPREAEIVSHRLMLRAGMMRQEAAGIYAFLPLGLRVLKKIEQIVREEQNRAGAIELLMPTIQSADLWSESGRYEAYGKEMLRIEDRHERDMLYGPTNEEMITEIFRAYVRSYKDLPLNLYHIQWKFRDEVRPRFGLMRGREFLMKDAYSFDVDQAGARHSYNKMFVAYLRTFARLGLKSIPMRGRNRADRRQPEPRVHHPGLDRRVRGVLPQGLSGSSGAGRRRRFRRRRRPAGHRGQMDLELCGDLGHARRRGVRRKLPADKQVSARGIEVGHIFYFGTKYSEPMKAVVTGPDGVEKPVHMGSYGIGPSRLVAAIIEASHDDAGIKWPEAVAPFKVAILNLKQGDSATDARLRAALPRSRWARASMCSTTTPISGRARKFATADLIGVPWQVVIGPKGLAAGTFEVKKRADGSRENLSPGRNDRPVVAMKLCVSVRGVPPKLA